MVLPNSHGIPRAPRYLGVQPRESDTFRLQDCHLLWLRLSRPSTMHRIDHFPTCPETGPVKSRDPEYTTLPGFTYIRFGLFPFARRYLGNHSCFLLLRLLRCFSSPRSPLHPMDSGADVPTLPGTGSPIQKSPDQSLFGSSPRLIAACHVFLRLLTPRHPPSALNSLATNCLTQVFKNSSVLSYLVVKDQPEASHSILKSSSIQHNTSILGGGERIRTDDLLRARQALSQLSYTP